MTAFTHAGNEPEHQERSWEDPLTRLLLLLEIANEPTWLREAAAARAVGTARTGTAPGGRTTA